jgi:hypothetical protein
MQVPYQVRVDVTGVADFISHRWNVEGIKEKAGSAKGSKAKKSDDLESYVYRDEHGNICIPGTYLIGALIGAAKYKQDPRSPRKSAQDLFKAGVVSLTGLASLGTKEWHYEHAERVQVQRNGVTRIRPAFRGWKATFELQVLLPEYIAPDLLQHTLVDAGRLCGLGDHRPTYGRFAVTHFEPLDLR